MANECKGCAHDSIFRSIECIACEYDVQTGLRSKFKQKTKTNADRIRAMTDKEMATDLLDMFEEICEDGVPSEEWMLHWLKQPAEEE